MRGKKCWKRVTAVLMAFMMLVGLVMTNGITSEAYWYNSEGERYPNVGYRTHVQSKGWERTLTLNGRTSGTVGAGKRLEAIQIIVEPGMVLALSTVHIFSQRAGRKHGKKMVKHLVQVERQNVWRQFRSA